MGIEKEVYNSSELCVSARFSGLVNFSSNKKLVVFSDFKPSRKSLINIKSVSSIELKKGSWYCKKNFYFLNDLRKSNQSSVLNQISVLNSGDWVRKGDFIVDGNCSLAGKVCK